MEDMQALVESFEKYFCAKHRWRQKKIHREVLALFQTLPWPGNVRHLRNLIERLVVTIPRAKIELADLPPALVQNDTAKDCFGIEPGMTLAHVEAELIRPTRLKL